MKKMLSMVLSASMVLSLAACGGLRENGDTRCSPHHTGCNCRSPG